MVTCLPDAQIYAKQLLLKRHGYPLWVPEPFGNSAAYRTKGVRIGDVGYVTPDGAFETLFNLRAARTDPINARGVPEGFEQVMVPEEDIVRIPNYHQPNGTVTSASAKKRTISCEVVTPGITLSQTHQSNHRIIVTKPHNHRAGGAGVGAGAQFTWNSSEGAILHLPDGASRITSPAEVFRDAALRGAKSWYKFANVTLHRGVPNGALYLVTGSDKTRSWMVGTFSDASSDSRASLKLDLASFGAAGISYSYTWESSSPAVFRTGPQLSSDPCDMLPRHHASILRDNEVFYLDAPDGQNQCVFLRGYRIMLRMNSVSFMLGISTRVDVESIINTNPKNIFQPTAKSPYTPSGNLPNAYNDSAQSGGSKALDCAGSFDDDDEVMLEYYPEASQPYHPSDAINSFLLSSDPHATAAVTHDDEWCSVVLDGEPCFPDDEALILRISNRFDIVSSNTSAFLYLKGPISEKSASVEDACAPFRPVSIRPASNAPRTSPSSESRREFCRTALASKVGVPRKVSDQVKDTKGKYVSGTSRSGSSYLADLSNSSRTFVENREDRATFAGAPWDHRRGFSEMIERAGNTLTCPRSLPRKRLKPNGRPNTAPNSSTCCKQEGFKAIRRQRSFEV